MYRRGCHARSEMANFLYFAELLRRRAALHGVSRYPPADNKVLVDEFLS
jgi:hypothetical protein